MCNMGEFTVKIVEHVLRRPIRKILKHVTAVAGVDTELAVLAGDTAVSV